MELPTLHFANAGMSSYLHTMMVRVQRQTVAVIDQCSNVDAPIAGCMDFVKNSIDLRLRLEEYEALIKKAIAKHDNSDREADTKAVGAFFAFYNDKLETLLGIKNDKARLDRVTFERLMLERTMFRLNHLESSVKQSNDMEKLTDATVHGCARIQKGPR